MSSRIFWLKSGSALVIGFGLMIATAAYPPVAGGAEFLIDLIKWPVDGTQSLGSPEARLLCAILGGITIGWGLQLWLIVTYLLPRDPQLGRILILISVSVWFVIDSMLSIAAGAPLNAVLNISFLLIFILPALGLSEETVAA